MDGILLHNSGFKFASNILAAYLGFLVAGFGAHTAICNRHMIICKKCISFVSKVVVEPGKSSAFIKVAALCHPSLVTVDDIKGMDF
ncbi:hypothetical protein SADUNF_Sadunf02G0055100 [Salix dunnii]|uniref:Uncharacterized protein n=1 Tax=Salix dunnii TaxID=1413687 RepID=A0A835N672_9ROSI|nr:hypothetical protein SADUNF_Sadunf02G0055100 [Salix dunnii]